MPGNNACTIASPTPVPSKLFSTVQAAEKPQIKLFLFACRSQRHYPAQKGGFARPICWLRRRSWRDFTLACNFLIRQQM